MAVRDKLIDDYLKPAGMKVITDVDEGQGKADNTDNGVKLSKTQKRALETASVSQEEKHHPTVVSSDSSAKLLKKIDSLVNKLEKVSNYRKNFLDEIGNAIEAEQEAIRLPLYTKRKPFNGSRHSRPILEPQSARKSLILLQRY